MAEVAIPNLPVNGWERHVMTGVPGGIAAKRASRTTLTNVVTYGADPTGVSSSSTAFNDALAGVGSEGVLFMGYGVFRLTSQVYYGTKQQFTFRGSGMGVPFAGTHTIETGIKTFSVPAGLGWTTGIAARVWKRNDDRFWMQGIVVSYSGTSLVVDVTDTFIPSGGATSASEWTASQTLVVYDSDSGSPPFSNASTFIFGGRQAITGSPVAGANTITVADATDYPGGSFIDIVLRNGAEVYNNGGYKEDRRMMNRVVSRSGNVLTLEVPLYYDLPSDLSPTVGSGSLLSREIGFEEFAIVGGTTNTPPNLLYFDCHWHSWAYKVRAQIAKNYQLTLSQCLRCEIACVAAGRRFGLSGSSGSSLITGSTTACLFRHVVLADSDVASLMGAGDVGNAYLHVYAPNCFLNTNHGAHNSYNLFEYCILRATQSDGYFGSQSDNTRHGLLLIGGGGALGWVIDNRWNRRHNTIKCQLGVSGVVDGGHSEGNPNMGNGYSDGTSNSVLGTLGRHVDADGNSRMIGEITANDGTHVTVTLSFGDLADFTTPRYLNNETSPFHILWSGGVRRGMTIHRAGSSGANIKFEVASGSGDSLPANGTDVSIYMGPYGSQELDLAVAETAFKKHNFIALAAGGGTWVNQLTGEETLPDSLGEPGADEDWPAGTAWPPPIGSSHVTDWTAINPATRYYHEGEWPLAGELPDAPAAPTGLSATAASSSQINLAWTDEADNEAGFRVQQLVSGTWTQIATVAANVESYSVTGLSPSTEYSFRVLGYNGGGNSTPSNTATETTLAGGGGGGGATPALRSARAPRFAIPRP